MQSPQAFSCRFVLALAVILLLAACGQAPESPPTAVPSAPAPSVPRRPFPQHTPYTAGTILPSHLGRDELDDAVRAFYDAWKLAYLRRGCGEGRYYVFPGQGEGGGKATASISISEGHGYGMLIAVIMAGHDPEARTIFDGLNAFRKDHPSVNRPPLMAWNQVEGCREADPDNATSATDGDLDIAYALLLADQQWGSGGRSNYRQEAIATINALKARVVNPETQVVMLGDWVTAEEEAAYYYGARPSDFMPDHWRAFARETNDQSWLTVIDTAYRLIESMQARFSPRTGLLPDFIRDTNAAPRPADAGYLGGAADGQFSYNAVRVPWRLATDYLLSGDGRARAALSPMNRWIRAKTGDDPALVAGGYTLAGRPAVDFTETVYATMLGVGAMVEADNQGWLNAVWRQAVAEPLAAGDYYSNTLTLLGLIVMSGNWW